MDAVVAPSPVLGIAVPVLTSPVPVLMTVTVNDVPTTDEVVASGVRSEEEQQIRSADKSECRDSWDQRCDTLLKVYAAIPQ